MHDTPQTVRATEFGGRFKYWTGASGRRYLFSTVPVEDIADFAGAVVLIASRSARHIWLGETDERGSLRGCVRMRKPRNPLAFVHLLSAGEGDRRAVIDDIAAAAA